MTYFHKISGKAQPLESDSEAHPGEGMTHMAPAGLPGYPGGSPNPPWSVKGGGGPSASGRDAARNTTANQAPRGAHTGTRGRKGGGKQSGGRFDKNSSTDQTG